MIVEDSDPPLQHTNRQIGIRFHVDSTFTDTRIPSFDLVDIAILCFIFLLPLIRP